MDHSLFKGTGVALITPFREDKSIDFSALEKLVNYQIENGTNYLVVLGTTSEAATLSPDERNAVLDFVIDINNNRLPLVVGGGGNNTAKVINGINKNLNKPGVDALLSVVPYYNKPNQSGIYEHFKTIANTISMPIILYNVPGRTAANISAETTLKLAHKFSNIIGIKEASGNWEQMMQLVNHKKDNFLVLSGDDGTTLPLISVGLDGVISVVANAFPKDFSEMVRLAINNQIADARKLHYKLFEIINTLFTEGNPAGVKAYLTLQGMIKNNLRLPLVPVSKKLFTKIEQQFIKYESQ